MFDYLPVNKNEKPVLTIVTPYFNPGEVFRDTVRAIFNQSLQQWEWIIVNDGSNDWVSLNILEEYRHIDPRIRVVDHPNNLGPSAARNTGYKEASSDYVIYVDADDLIEPTTLEVFYWFLVTHPQFYFVNSFSIGFGAKQYLWARGFHDGEQNREENFIDYTALIRREILVEVGGFDSSIRHGGEDWDFWLKCASKGYWGYTIPEYFKWYRTREDHSDRWLNFREENLKSLKDGFKKKYPELWNGKFPSVSSSQRQHYQPIPDLSGIVSNHLVKRKKRLLMILPYLVVGGADRYNYDLVSILVNEGWEVSIVTTLASDNTFYSQFSKLTSDIFILPNFLEIQYYPSFISYLIRSRNFDLVMIQNSHFGYLLVPYLKHTFPELPLIDLTHTVTPDWFSGGYPRLSVLYQNFFSANVVISNQIRDWMKQNGALPEKIRVVHWGIDLEIWNPNPDLRRNLRKKLGVSEDDIVIIYNARLVEGKQPDVFFYTIERLCQLDDSLRAVVIGDGPLFNWLRDLVVDHGLEQKIVLLGALEPEKVREWLNVGDIIFLPSVQEGIPLVFYEGMAMGLVPVGANVGGTAELVTPDCGILIERSNFTTKEGEIEAYVQVISSISKDRDRLGIMKLSSRRQIENYFDIEHMRGAVIQIFEDIMRNANRGQVPDVKDFTAVLLQNALEIIQYQQESLTLWRELSNLRTENGHLKYSLQQAFWTVPPLRSSAFFYFGMRALLLDYYQKLREVFPWLDDVKEKVKKVLSVN
jgi:glycosyltransferase involved in cell wall biosynthesis